MYAACEVNSAKKNSERFNVSQKKGSDCLSFCTVAEGIFAN